MFYRNQNRNQRISAPNRTQHLHTTMPIHTEHNQTSFPELVGRSAREAASYIAARGLHPVILRANDPMTRDLRMDRVRIIVDPSRRVVIRTPNIG